MPCVRPTYFETIRFRAPEGLSAALAQAAARDFTSISEFARRALIDRLQEAGIATTVRGERQHGGRAHFVAKGDL